MSAASLTLFAFPLLASSTSLDFGLTLETELVGQDAIKVTLTSDMDTWVGIGFSPAQFPSMTGNSEGVDTVICSGTEGVKRYWMTSYNTPSGGVPMEGATCTRVDGTTKMVFQRKLAAESEQQIAVMPGTSQQIIYARGDSGPLTLSYHGNFRGGAAIDVATGAVTVVEVEKSGHAALTMHVIFMCVSWGALLPYGVVLAKRLRFVPPAWFHLHRGIQYAGWFFQLIGFAMAIWYVQERSTHFKGLHKIIGLVVTAIGTLQPLNALVRPHAPVDAEDKKPTTRIIWEHVHKKGGYFAVVVGYLNCVMGVLLMNSRGHDMSLILLAIILLAMGLVLIVLHVVKPWNAFTRKLAALCGYTGSVDPESGKGDSPAATKVEASKVEGS